MRKIMLLGMAGLAAAMLWGCGQKDEPIMSSVAMSWAGPTYETVEELEDDSDLAVIGTPVEIEGFRTTSVSSMVTIEVEEVLKGTPPEKLILFQYGGEYQNEICMPPEEFPLLEVGKTYLLYLNDDYIHDGETLYTVVGGYQGVAVDTDGEWTALSEANGLWPFGPAASEG